MKMTMGTLAMSTLCAGASVALMGGSAADVLIGQVCSLIVFFVGAAIIDVTVEDRGSMRRR